MLYLSYTSLISSFPTSITYNHADPPCKCNTIIYKRKYSMLPYITGLLKDSATEKPLISGALTINGVIVRVKQQGRASIEVDSHKRFKTVAKIYGYYFCSKNLVVTKGDSVVCVFYMRKNRQPEN